MATKKHFLLPTVISTFIDKHVEAWLSKRLPKSDEHQLNSANIIIYPTRFGLSYVAFVILVFVLGTNYQNNIILLLSYLLASLFMSVMLHSFYNLSQLRCYSQAKQQGYADDVLYFVINITTKKTHYDINAQFSDGTLNSTVEKIAQCHQGSHLIKIPYKSSTRGKHYLGRVSVFSEYSLGIFKSKAMLDFGHYAIIYPKPKYVNYQQYSLSAPLNEASYEHCQTVATLGTDDFFELKPFVKGESRARTAWKQMAKGQGHYSKHYQANQPTLTWLSLDSMPGNNVETKLAYLSFLITELTANNQSFGLVLGTETGDETLTITPNVGVLHQQDCLTALALYR
ncbi:DUF58 domain-containing protein [Colwellia ponticola]|uniref:DUF58 domain-containing protein n=1 Tax=Colwellia ponticola TaxID=2304625 RepID=A0A8H2PLZ5_9GAMM|nr:DUF58 domain-containing protein [Colwellia ponticola]TMM43767.1 DUF58 domain-containing protein [Colwellia ponticola]